MSEMKKPEAPVKATAASRKFWEHTPVDIERSGNKITLPEDPQPMAIKDAIAALKRKQEDESQVVNSYEEIAGFPLDAAVAFSKAMAQMFGWASPVPTPGFFGDTPPNMVGVQISKDETAQVVIGTFSVPNLEGTLRTAVRGNTFVIVGETTKRHAYIVRELAEATRAFLREESIYRGKAIRVKGNGSDWCSIDNPPVFMDVDGVNVDEIILNEDVAEMVGTSIFAPIKHTDKCRSIGIPLNRGVLLSGQYGVGKTMIARATAKVCEDNGWTFVLIDRAEYLAHALEFAQMYSPAVVFCEDIDRAVNERNERANDLLNTIDGIVTKNAEVISVMTTNHVEAINPAMLRPGRLDAVITVAAPDKKSVAKLIEVYSRGLLKEGETLDRVSEYMAGSIPASIREMVERGKLRAIQHMNGSGLVLTEDDLLAAAKEMKVHMALLERPKADNPYETYIKARAALQDAIDAETSYNVEEVHDMVSDVQETVDRIYNAM